MKDLFGQEIIDKLSLRDQFIEPPFSVLDARGRAWQERKYKWIQLGIQSELGRDAISSAQSINKYDYRKSYTGKSIFDSVLCELMYAWFCPAGGTILDPFAGGSVRGIIAGYKGYHYYGIELRQQQVNSNYDQMEQMLYLEIAPVWKQGDSDKILDDMDNEIFDMCFTCPPYHNLEVYSADKRDLSNMDYTDFLIKYKKIIIKTVKKIKAGGTIIFMLGDIRDKKTGYYKNLVWETKKIFNSLPVALYNEAIYLENGLNTAAMRANHQFKNKKLVKVHQQIIMYHKLGADGGYN